MFKSPYNSIASFDLGHAMFIDTDLICVLTSSHNEDVRSDVRIKMRINTR